jgi:hypothetical protein
MLSKVPRDFSSFDRSVEHRGEWWVPEAPGRRVPGVLRLADGFQLELEKPLVKPLPPSPGISSLGAWDEIEERSVIYGDLQQGSRVTLIDAWRSTGGIPPELAGSELWRGQPVLVGFHVGPDAQFDRIAVSTDYLLDWTGYRGYSLEIEPGGVGVRARDEELFSLEYGHRYSLWSDFGFSNHHEGFDLKTSAYWRVDLSRPMHLRDAIEEVVAPLQDLVSFATMRPNRISSLHVRPVGEEKLGELIMRLRGDSSPLREEKLYYFDQLMPLQRIGVSRLRSVLPGWLSAYRRLRIIINRLLAIDYAPFLYDNHKAANILQAAEGLHRELWDRTGVTPEEHSARIDAALARSLSEEASAWARDILEDKNGLSQKTRYSEIIDRSLEAGFPYEVADKTKYVKTLTKLRNKPAHGSAPCGDPETNFWNTEGLRWMLRAILLHEVGLDPSAVAKLLSDLSVMRHAATRLSWTPIV